MAPFGRYFRSLSGATFSLQANTPETPVEDHFYVLDAGEVLLETDDFGLAEARYKELCRAYWDAHLESPDVAVGLASAWGLLGLDSEHAQAVKLITRNGTAADHKRLQQLRNRARHSKGAVGWRRRSA
jgi:hypothetical protein